MKIWKIILIVVGALIAIPFIVALFVQKDYAVEREVTIDKPLVEVFDYVRFLNNQDNFSKWATMDPNMKKSFRGTDGTVGFVSAWESDKKDVGKGEQEIIKVTEGKRIDYELRFKEPFEATDLAYITTEPISENQTLVKWGFNGRMKYPMNLMLITMDFDKMLGDDLNYGLLKLKEIMEE
jgi:uncharacterized protein YndB with AHSA1/START domain